MKTLGILLLHLFCFQVSFSQSVSEKQVDLINSEIWGRFVANSNTLVEYTDLDGKLNLPLPSEVVDGMPNALGWWSPLENASFFGGIFMDGAIKRWQHTKKSQDSVNVKRLAKGLMLLASVSSVEGFFARGISTDGKSHYPMSSDDQAGGWFYGIWRYLQTSLPSDSERVLISNKFISTAKAIVKLNWSIPAEAPFYKRGSFSSFDDRAARLLFVCKACFSLTKDNFWDSIYRTRRNDLAVRNSTTTRLNILRNGIPSGLVDFSTWHRSPSIGCLRLLWELETDSTIKDIYRQGLEVSANNAMLSITSLGNKMPYIENSKFDIDWRNLNSFWKNQSSDTVSYKIAIQQLLYINANFPRRNIENMFVREPSFAAWVICQAPNESLLRQRSPDLQQLIDHFNFKNLYEIWFFPLESVAWRLKDL